MKDLIVNSLELICKTGFVILLACGVIGFLAMLADGKLFAGIAFLLLTFVVGVIAFGGIFLMLEINENLRAIRKNLEEKNETKSA